MVHEAKVEMRAEPAILEVQAVVVDPANGVAAVEGVPGVPAIVPRPWNVRIQMFKDSIKQNNNELIARQTLFQEMPSTHY